MNYDELMGSLRSTWTSRIILTFVELGIADVLAEGPLHSHEIAKKLHCDERSIELFLNAVTATGLTDKDGEKFRNSPMAAEKLVKTSPEYGGNGVLHYVQLWDSWSKLSTVVRDGKPAECKKERTVEEYHQFVGAMHDYSYGRALAVAETIDLSKVNTLLDLGGGPGSFAIAFAQKNEKLKATIYDLPPALDVAKETCKRYKMTDRIELETGDFLKDELKGKYDVVWASHIIHSLDPDTNIKLIKDVKTMINPGGQLYIQDFYLNDDKVSPPNSAVFSINMLVNCKGGRTYTFTEVKGWLKDAGYEDIEIIDSPPGADVIRATKSL